MYLFRRSASNIKLAICDIWSCTCAFPITFSSIRMISGIAFGCRMLFVHYHSGWSIVCCLRRFLREVITLNHLKLKNKTFKSAPIYRTETWFWLQIFEDIPCIYYKQEEVFNISTFAGWFPSILIKLCSILGVSINFQALFMKYFSLTS